MLSSDIVAPRDVLDGMVFLVGGIRRHIVVSNAAFPSSKSGIAATSGIFTPPTVRFATVKIKSPPGRTQDTVASIAMSRSRKNETTLWSRSAGSVSSLRSVALRITERELKNLRDTGSFLRDPPRLAVSRPRIAVVESHQPDLPRSSPGIHCKGKYEAWPYATVV